MEGLGGELRAFLYRSQVAGQCLLLWERMDPHWTHSALPSPIMESHICESMDPQSSFGNFAIMGPLFVWLLFGTVMSRSHDLIIR